MPHRRQFIGLAALAALGFSGQGRSALRWQQPERLLAILAQMPEALRAPIAQPEAFRLQILWSQPLANGRWRHERFRVGAEWTAPASMVKVPMALLALAKLKQLGLPRSTQLRVLEPASCAAQAQEIAEFEPIARTLRRMLMVSDNGAYNRLWEFVGADTLARELPKLGFPEARLQARLGNCTPADNQLGRGYELADHNGRVLKRDVVQRHLLVRAPTPSPQVGHAYYDAQLQLQNQPKDFGFSNHWPLEYAHALTLSLAAPELQPNPWLARLAPGDLEFLRRSMSTLPRESQDPSYEESAYPDRWGKFLLWGDQPGRMPSGLKIVNKIGEAYGFLSDSAWIRQGTRSCVLSATLYVNSDEVLNDDHYEYEQLGYPFLAELGRRVLAAS